jgi:hypothetical protein
VLAQALGGRHALAKGPLDDVHGGGLGGTILVGCEGMPSHQDREGGVMTMNKLGTRHRFGIYDSD